jgi:beta-lactamase class A
VICPVGATFFDMQKPDRFTGRRSIAAVALAGALTAATASGGVSPTASAATSISSFQVQTVTCPDLGSLTLALPSGVASPPLPAGVQLSVSYRAIDARTGTTVTDGQPPGAVQCATVPFTDLRAADVSPGPPPAGVATGDALTGSWLVSVTVNLPPLPTVPPSSAQQSAGFSFDGPVQAYLATRAGSASVAVFDARTGAIDALAAQNSYFTASTVKVDILATLLRQAQDAGRGLTSAEQATATQMIEVSDNNAATAMWNAIGGAPALARFNSLVGMPNTVPGAGGWWGLTSTTTPDQVQLMRVVAYPNPVLTDGSRAYIEALMENVTPSQRWGVNGGVPAGVTVALKNGAEPANGSWEVSGIGHVFGAGQDYVIAVLTSGNPDMAYGITTINGASSLVWAGMPHGGGLSAGLWYLRNELTTGSGDVSLSYGDRGDTPIVGDWNGDGKDTPGVVRGISWYLRNELTTGSGDISLSYGNPGDTPIVGDWTGSGKDGIGVVRNSVWYLRNELTSGNADVAFTYGDPGDIPIVGDWTGSGKDGIGVVRGTTWYLRNELSSGTADIVLSYGDRGDIPIVGDWTGSGKDGVGVFRGSLWYLHNTLTTGVADTALSYGNSNDIPLTGEWLGGKATRPGVAR